jgi:hypothetical protein
MNKKELTSLIEECISELYEESTKRPSGQNADYATNKMSGYYYSDEDDVTVLSLYADILPKLKEIKSIYDKADYRRSYDHSIEGKYEEHNTTLSDLIYDIEKGWR